MKWMVLGCDSEPGLALIEALLNEQRSTQQVASAVGVAGTDCRQWVVDPRYTFLKFHFNDSRACPSLFEHIEMYAPDIIVFSPSVLKATDTAVLASWMDHQATYETCLLFPAQLCWWIKQRSKTTKFILISGERQENDQIQISYNSAMSALKSLISSFQKTTKDQFQVFELSSENQMSLGSLATSAKGAFQTKFQTDARKLISLALSAPKNGFHKTV